MTKNSLNYVGHRIKQLRTAKKLTLKDMVEYTGLSLGYLSNVERNATSPTLSALDNICAALNVSITDLLHVATPKQTLIRPAERSITLYPEQLLTVETVEFDDQEIIVQYLTIEAGEPAETPFWRHAYAELCTVLQGQLEVTIEEKTYLLEVGDFLAVDRNLRHATRNPTDSLCVSQWIHCK